jgi:hypothetical protein
MWMFGRSSAIDAIASLLSEADAGAPSSFATTISAALDVLPPATQRYVSLGAKSPGKVLTEAIRTLVATVPATTLPADIASAFDAVSPSPLASGYAFDPPTERIGETYLLVAQSESDARAIERVVGGEALPAAEIAKLREASVQSVSAQTPDLNVK